VNLPVAVSERIDRVARTLGRAIEVKASSNITGAIWSKLLINCSVTNPWRALFSDHAPVHGNRGRKEGLPTDVRGGVVVAFATGIGRSAWPWTRFRPAWASNVAIEQRYESWVEEIIAFYGDVKPSMLQDFEAWPKTEIDFINGYVVALGHASGVPVHMNATITDLYTRLNVEFSSRHENG